METEVVIGKELKLGVSKRRTSNNDVTGSHRKHFRKHIVPKFDHSKNAH